MMRVLLLLLMIGAAHAQTPVLPSLIELRYCYAPADVPRDAAGRIIRSSSVIYRFRQAHPCPVTGLRDGACTGWSIDHIIPLVCGGCDSVNNLQWLPNSIKSGPDADDKDRWEQRVYCVK